MFNSGVVLLPDRPDLALRLRGLTVAALKSPDLPDAVKHPFADQLALACLALEQPAAVTVLPRHWNSPISTSAEKAGLWHYFAFTRLAQTDTGQRLIRSLQEEFAAQGINLLGEWSGRDVCFTKPRRHRAGAEVAGRSTPPASAPRGRGSARGSSRRAARPRPSTSR